MIPVGKYGALGSEGRITEMILAFCIIVRLLFGKRNNVILSFLYLVNIEYHKQ